MYKEDLALNHLQWLICQKTKPKQTKQFFHILTTFSDGIFSVVNKTFDAALIR